MNTTIATILTVSGVASGFLTGGVAPIILLSSGLGFSVAEIINTLKD